jgi:hypothetical protein
MKTIENMGAQGDLMIRRVDSVPEGYAPVKREANGHVVAHSETGHHHVVREAQGAAHAVLHRTTDTDPDTAPASAMVAYLEVLEEHADLVHLRTWDTHETIRLGAGTWELRRQREYIPEGWRRVED